jgi:hypothetical protein
LLLLDGEDGWFWSRGFKDETQYSDRYTNGGFRRVAKAMPEQAVEELLGEPLGEVWWYSGDYSASIEGNAVTSTTGNVPSSSVSRGTTRTVLLATWGQPLRKSWFYSRRGQHTSCYRERTVVFSQGHVVDKIHQFSF